MSFPDSSVLIANFPELSQKVHNKRLVYLDNGATTLKPACVLDKLKNFYEFNYATVHRGAYQLSENATHEFEAVRKKVATFLNAPSHQDIIYTRGTTESINLVANTWGKANLKAGDEILISQMEHHSNIVPWQMLAQSNNCLLRVMPMNDKGELILEDIKNLISEKTKLLVFNHISNALGTINPVKELVALARSVGAKVMLDGAQSAAHLKVDVVELDVDFFAFSSHKIYGPTGVGILYGKTELLNGMPPWQGGGDMIEKVTFEKTTYAEPPARFEAGTPAIAEVIGMGAAIDYLMELGMNEIAQREHDLMNYALQKMSTVPGLKFIGQAEQRAGAISFTLKDIHPHDIATILDGEGVAIRAGHHCAQPVMQHFGVPATARASLGIYNTQNDIEALIGALNIVNDIF
jgi:cysteine desulfurase/selenocysteine lyase